MNLSVTAREGYPGDFIVGEFAKKTEQSAHDIKKQLELDTADDGGDESPEGEGGAGKGFYGNENGIND